MPPMTRNDGQASQRGPTRFHVRCCRPLAGTRNQPKTEDSSGVSMSARRRTFGIWEEKGFGEAHPSRGALTARGHTQERKKEDEGEMGKEEGGGTAPHLPESSSSNLSSAPIRATSNTCGGVAAPDSCCTSPRAHHAASPLPKEGPRSN
jgi:hypothetical protein